MSLLYFLHPSFPLFVWFTVIYICLYIYGDDLLFCQSAILCFKWLFLFSCPWSFLWISCPSFPFFSVLTPCCSSWTCGCFTNSSALPLALQSAVSSDLSALRSFLSQQSKLAPASARTSNIHVIFLLKVCFIFFHLYVAYSLVFLHSCLEKQHAEDHVSLFHFVSPSACSHMRKRRQSGTFLIIPTF